LTYGKKPYEGIPAHQIADSLMKGERLKQPVNTTLELFMIIVKCWMNDVDARPSFTRQDQKELIRANALLMDGPETIMDAEEYLQPSKSMCPFDPQPSTPIKKFMDESEFDDHGGFQMDTLNSRMFNSQNSYMPRHLGPEAQYNNKFMHNGFHQNGDICGTETLKISERGKFFFQVLSVSNF